MHKHYKKPRFYDLTKDQRTFPEDDSFYHYDDPRQAGPYNQPSPFTHTLKNFNTESATRH